MDNFRGEATVLADGAEYPCRATLWRRTEHVRSRSFGGLSSSQGLTIWGGTIKVEGDVFAVQQAEDPQLSIVRVSSFSIADGDLSEGVLRINGSGDAPFD
ncbi:hypothetical protein MHW47_06010 [Streptomyces sp. OfavH-34-F]|uniref:hypothetical protein n=1 Tax=Streptomyces sp. OfavH-34-F TaxID=2917760 RepID=UPI001EF20763|nr:hypothetical protein [Streptomyces sp. OfavH-34-F]MCG7523996.1 hypothetical protein [Streptomyces sp. OfavH-34-F]